MSSTIGDRMADFHWVTEDQPEEGTTRADADDPTDEAPAPEKAADVAAGDDAADPDDEEGEIAPWAVGIDWGVVKREVGIMLKLNPNATIPDQAEADQGEPAPAAEPEA